MVAIFISMLFERMILMDFLSSGLGYYFILFVSLLLTLGSQAYINGAYRKTKKIKSKSAMSGYDVARKILDANGLKNVKVQEVNGTLTDHYDPKSKIVNLSNDIYNGTSLASISVASHECGHAIQDKEGYSFLRLRHQLVPFVNIASRAGYIIIMISIFASLLKLLWIGIALEFVILLFQLVTLPVEFNASNRALKKIVELKIVDEKELSHCKSMLTAAALTYVASVATAILEIIRLIAIARRDD